MYTVGFCNKWEVFQIVVCRAVGMLLSCPGKKVTKEAGIGEALIASQNAPISLLCDCPRQSFIRFAARRTALCTPPAAENWRGSGQTEAKMFRFSPCRIPQLLSSVVLRAANQNLQIAGGNHSLI